METSPPLVIRHLTKGSGDEWRLVHSAWTRSVWEALTGPAIKYAEFLAGQRALQTRLIDRSTVRVIEFDGVPEVLGFSVVEGDTLHYVYVKHDFRRQHLATALSAGCREFSVCTTSGKKLAEDLHLTYNPYRVF